MLSQLANLSVEADGRYAVQSELQFLKDYFQSLNLRLSAYKKIQAAEKEIIRDVETKILSTSPNLLLRGSQDATSKWRLDTVRVLRHSAAALLIDDRNRLRDRLLLWFQTILGSFQAKKSSEVTFQIMQDAIKQYLTAEEASLFIPILEMSRTTFSK
ncbi:phycobilisome protein [Kamptonema sp. UHCC 0994]|uniref:phycobilisome protein n=1 Tax=Kamptonema sp. UHCC 0994 TaxID=3031329 RepID=UPI0023B90144|nr:phycobilisome protein [Kamptonema sp. UHCC 0994]MDF0554742.1 phycobilisome protein [Kamptonema sp. UHCC 0994]